MKGFKMKMKKKFGAKVAAGVGAGLASIMLLSGCSSDATIVDSNLSKAADNFEIDRRIVFLNVRTGKYELEVQGRCAISDSDNQLEVLCRVGPDEYKKHFLGKAGDFTYFAEQLEVSEASAYHYRVIFKPQSIVPAPELNIG